MKKLVVYLALFLMVIASACDVIEPENKENVSKVEFSFKNLKQLPDTLTYVVWNTFKDRMVNNKKVDGVVDYFNVNQDGTASFVTDKVLFDIHDMVTFFVTIEDTTGHYSETYPSVRGLRIIEGSLFANDVDITSKTHMGSYSGTNNYYTVFTPTDDLTDNEKSGFWFVDSVGFENGPVAGLGFGVAGTGYTYEAFIEINGTEVSTGEFSSAIGADLDNSYSGANPFGFPGEDFLNNAPSGLTFPTDLSGAKISVVLKATNPVLSSIITYPVLEATIPQDVQTGTSYMLNVVEDVLPEGTAKIIIEI